MIRSFNYTQRRRIPKANAVVRLRPDGNGGTAFDVDLNLVAFELPSTARVYVEAYFKGTLMRFDFGTVGAIRPPNPRSLTRLPQPELTLFRLKVVSQNLDQRGLVLAQCERILPRQTEGGPAMRQSLFRVQLIHLENEVWRLEFDDDGPVLQLDPAFREQARHDASFAALVYPDVIRRVLSRVLRDHDDPDTTDDWRAPWLRFGRQLTGKPNPSREDESVVEEWIDEVVAGFVGQRKLLPAYQRTFRSENVAV